MLYNILRYNTLALFLFLNNQLLFAQVRDSLTENYLIELYKKEGVTVKSSIETLVYMHYQAIEGNFIENSAIFYFEESGIYSVKTSGFYNIENADEMVSNLNTSFTNFKLENEEYFQELDRDWIKQKLLENSERDQANYIYINKNENIRVFRTYRLFK